MLPPILISFIPSAAVELRSVDHAQGGPTPDSFVYIEGQNMTFVCNATPSSPFLFWEVELTRLGATGVLVLANHPRIETGDTTNADIPSNITILNAMMGDSNTTVRCKDGRVGNIVGTLTIYVEGESCCMYAWCIHIVVFLLCAHALNYNAYT